MGNRSYRTALHRRRLSVPMRWLHRHGLLRGRMLDYGCGHGYDAAAMGMEGYDPYWRPHIAGGVGFGFDTITCIYVLNVIESRRERAETLRHICALLRRHGEAYVAIRADHAHMRGHTRHGTWQGYVAPLPAPWQRIYATAQWELWAFSHK